MCVCVCVHTRDAIYKKIIKIKNKLPHNNRHNSIKVSTNLGHVVRVESYGCVTATRLQQQSGEVKSKKEILLALCRFSCLFLVYASYFLFEENKWKKEEDIQICISTKSKNSASKDYFHSLVDNATFVHWSRSQPMTTTFLVYYLGRNEKLTQLYVYIRRRTFTNMIYLLN